MARPRGNDSLVCQHGSFRWSDFVVGSLPSGGYGVMVDCDLGDHYLALGDNGVMIIQTAPFAWDSYSDAAKALIDWRVQQNAQ